MIKIKKGLNILLSGVPEQKIGDSIFTQEVGVLGIDYKSLKPKLLVNEGDKVKIGTPLLINKENPSVNIVAPCSGSVVNINRGFRRSLLSVVMADNGRDEQVQLKNPPNKALDNTNIVTSLLESGLWTAIRSRPYGYVAKPEDTPHSIFVTATDTNPLSVDPQLVIANRLKEFSLGVDVLAHLSNQVYVCNHQAVNLSCNKPNISQHQFNRLHPAGLVGTHIHHLDSVGFGEKMVWTINYQDVIAIGHFFAEGKIDFNRMVSIAGPKIKNPLIIKTKIGANLDELIANNLKDTNDENRLISGSVLYGHTSKEGLNFLGRYHLQVTALKEGNERPMLHYLQAGKNRFSKIPIFSSFLQKNRLWDFSTTTNGSERAMVPIEIYEEVMPLDILATQLLRALIVGDTETAVKLGCLELDEEDLALCTFVCPGKYDYAPILRKNLDIIYKEG